MKPADIPLLRKTLTEMRDIPGPKVLHVLTKKGKGFEAAEKDALTYYSLPGFNRETGEIKKAPAALPAYSKVFGAALVELGETNPQLHVVTAAMPTGTGTDKFGDKFPERYHDVGIAEQHDAILIRTGRPDFVVAQALARDANRIGPP